MHGDDGSSFEMLIEVQLAEEGPGPLGHLTELGLCLQGRQGSGQQGRGEPHDLGELSCGEGRNTGAAVR